MDNIDTVKRTTDEFCKNDHDAKVLEEYFDPDFSFWTNGRRGGGFGDFASHLADLGKTYENMTIPNWDEIFAADDAVVVSYILEAHKKDGGTDRSAVMAVWRLKDGKIASLRQVLAGL